VRSPLPLAAASVLVTLVLVAVIGPFFVTGRANLQNLDYHFLPPFHLQNGFSFVLGADGLGRPMLLQVIIGARTSFITAGLSVGISAIVGSVVGMISGYFGGWLDAALMRISDVIQTMPSLMLALAILFVVGPSIRNLILVLAVTRVPVYMRVARSQTLEIRERVFVEAARAIGSSTPRMIARDISPLVIPTIMTVAMLEIANVILAAAGLSFLGVGLQRPDVDWGMLVAGGRSYLTQAWWVTLFPGLAVVITALAANILSNWLRAIEDPAQSGLFVKTPRVDTEPEAATAGRHDPPDAGSLLRVADLAVDFGSDRGQIRALRRLSFTLDEGESIAIVGESGSGKSVTGRALLGLVDHPGRVRGTIEFQGRNLVGAGEAELSRVRGEGIAMVFQDSLDSLNPVYSVGSQLSEILRVRRGLSRANARSEAAKLMAQVGIPNAARRLGEYPHQFSGGMRQRICIAMAIALRPQVLIADEPTTALDVTVQAGILGLIRRLQRETQMALIFITHDLSVARLVANRVAVMYCGQIVEQGPIEEIFARPAHPYTRALLSSNPSAALTWDELRAIPGKPPDNLELVAGCAFHPRCPLATNRCRVDEPGLNPVDARRHSRCHYAADVLDGTR